MTVQLPEPITALLQEMGRTVDQRGDVLHLGLGQTALLVREEAGCFVVERVERGVVEGTDLETTSREALDRFLAVTIGGTWRSHHRLRPLRVAAREGAHQDRTAGAVRPDADAWSVEWVDVDGPRTARLWSKFDAQEVARSLTVPLEDVVACIREPDGGPLFDVA